MLVFRLRSLALAQFPLLLLLLLLLRPPQRLRLWLRVRMRVHQLRLLVFRCPLALLLLLLMSRLYGGTRSASSLSARTGARGICVESRLSSTRWCSPCTGRWTLYTRSAAGHGVTPAVFPFLSTAGRTLSASVISPSSARALRMR